MTQDENNKMVTHDGVAIDAVFSDNLKVFMMMSIQINMMCI